MKTRRLLVGLCIAMISACNTSQNSNETSAIPFFNSMEFTPEWIAEKEVKNKVIHTIGEFELTNQLGQTVTQKDVKMSVYVANFFFSTCPSICPKMMHNVRMVQDTFAQRNDVKILSHTVWPEVDSVSRLYEYAGHMDIDNQKWQLLTGDKEKIYKLARESYFAEEPVLNPVEDDFLHTEQVILVDRNGRIRGVYNGTLELEIKRMIEDIYVLLEE